MKKIKFLLPILTMVLLTACDVFLGHDPDINDPKEIINDLWTGIDETYAYFGHKKEFVDSEFVNKWNKARADALKKVKSDTTSNDLFTICYAMLAVLGDPHADFDDNVKVKFRYASYIGTQGYLNILPPPEPPFSTKINEGPYKYYNFYYGKFESPNENIGYIEIENFFVNKDHLKWWEEIDNILEYLKDTNALVIDVRGNSGGQLEPMRHIASRFFHEEKEYCKFYYKKGPGHNDFGAPIFSEKIKPPAERYRYTKRVVLLTNDRTFSAAEHFTLALRTQSPHITHMGTKTRGGFCSGISRRMINGWYYHVSHRKVVDEKGECWEGRGITPDEPIPNNQNEFEYALNWLNQNL
ncbi:MAG: S41 family peptidase [Treponema sp.]|jgi:C-terminal processing protease CtpA/Prc|nr:S41 family peptidase [Treponema sp.]